MADYPIVYVNNDGTVREVTVIEKLYLQTKFTGGDGARPYILSSLKGTESRKCFCSRSAVPSKKPIQKAEACSRADVESEIRRIRSEGYAVDLTGIDIKE